MSPHRTCSWPDARRSDGLCGRPVMAVYRHRRSHDRRDRCERHDTAAARRMADGTEWVREVLA